MCQAKFISDDPTWYEVTVDNARRLALPAHDWTNGPIAVPQALLVNNYRLVKHCGPEETKTLIWSHDHHSGCHSCRLPTRCAIDAELLRISER